MNQSSFATKRMEWIDRENCLLKPGVPDVQNGSRYWIFHLNFYILFSLIWSSLVKSMDRWIDRQIDVILGYIANKEEFLARLKDW